MKIKNIAIAGLLALGVGATTFTVYAQALYETPKEALSAMTGKSVEEIHELRQDEGITVPELFETEAEYDAFKNEVLEQRKERIEDRVVNGDLTRERADEILIQMEDGAFMMNGAGFGRGGECTTEGGPNLRNSEGKGINQGNGEQQGTRGHGMGNRR